MGQQLGGGPGGGRKGFRDPPPGPRSLAGPASQRAGRAQPSEADCLLAGTAQADDSPGSVREKEAATYAVTRSDDQNNHVGAPECAEAARSRRVSLKQQLLGPAPRHSSGGLSLPSSRSSVLPLLSLLSQHAFAFCPSHLKRLKMITAGTSCVPPCAAVCCRVLPCVRRVLGVCQACARRYPPPTLTTAGEFVLVSVLDTQCLVCRGTRSVPAAWRSSEPPR